jgi:hypothetical protein
MFTPTLIVPKVGNPTGDSVTVTVCITHCVTYLVEERPLVRERTILVGQVLGQDLADLDNVNDISR